MTRISKVTNNNQMICGCLLTLIGCCCIPFMLNECYTYIHYCQKCQNVIGHAT